MIRRSAMVLSVLLAVSCSPAAWAAEGDDPVRSTVGWIFRFINFVVIAGALVWLARKRGSAFFRARQETIVSAMNGAARAKADAERRLQDTEGKLARMEDEVEALRSTARRESSAEAERIRALTRDEMAKIERAAQGEIQAAERTARMELKAATARVAVDRATALLPQRLTADVQAGLFRVFLNDLARSVN